MSTIRSGCRGPMVLVMLRISMQYTLQRTTYILAIFCCDRTVRNPYTVPLHKEIFARADQRSCSIIPKLPSHSHPTSLSLPSLPKIARRF